MRCAKKDGIHLHPRHHSIFSYLAYKQHETEIALEYLENKTINLDSFNINLKMQLLCGSKKIEEAVKLIQLSQNKLIILKETVITQ